MESLRQLENFYEAIGEKDSERTPIKLDDFLRVIERREFDSVAGENSIQKLATVVKIGNGQGKPLAAKIANVVVSSKLFPYLTKEDRSEFLSVAGKEGAKKWSWWKEICQRVSNAFHFGLFSSEKTQKILEDTAMNVLRESRFVETRRGEGREEVSDLPPSEATGVMNAPGMRGLIQESETLKAQVERFSQTLDQTETAVARTFEKKFQEQFVGAATASPPRGWELYRDAIVTELGGFPRSKAKQS